ncbi:acetyl esterase/lipase [Streptosporangium becharense]|uniref:Acetyl esterase/lipase n=1 Tax=Streptosporangium becharense TaxID=1816182 RepID=A0A7W9MK03_9ACTN|nr:alpha/beta hydrolase [Streptosporangium becharense]MBB2910498.1 acetyl esterase/lipase [Streptosporangium becharense]MBB5823241.1 acetyl esterase/lipase [Streptosporangium becharense]
MDSELVAALAGVPKADFSDPAAARAHVTASIRAKKTEVEGIDRLKVEDRLIPGPDGAPDVPVRIYTPIGVEGPLPAALYFHSGGFVVGSVEAEHADAAGFALAADAVVVSVDYRLAPENPYPSALEDCYAALVWVVGNAAELGVDAERVAVSGSSAGGGLSAALCLLARDRGGPAICFQLLLIPELDDRLDTPSMLASTDTPMWNKPLAEISWRYYLGEDRGPDVPIYAAPARARVEDLAGLPPAYVQTAEHDPLRDEGLLYALKLLQAGVPVEIHQYAGTFHGSYVIRTAAVSVRQVEEMRAALRRALRG